MGENWSHILLNAFHLICLFTIVVQCIVHLNNMSPTTRHVIRAAYIGMAAGAVALVVTSVCFTCLPDVSQMAASASLAFYMIFSRRLRARTRFTDTQRNGARVNG